MGISIIMPVYNIAEEYIEASIRSVSVQTYTDWELIIVDDGSDEECAKYLDKMKNNKMRVIHKMNGGVSDARNVGIEAAKNEWIVFLDPDDCMKETQLEVMLSVAEKNQLDYVVANAYFLRGEKEIPGSVRTKDEICFDKSNRWELLLELMVPGRYQKIYGINLGNFLRTPWAKLYKKSIIQNYNIKFPLNVHPQEDFIFNLYYVNHSKKIMIINDYLHCYRINEDGVTRKVSNKCEINSDKAFKLCQKFFAENYPDAELRKEWNAFSVVLVQDICRIQVFNKYNKCKNKDRKKEIERILNSNPYYIQAINDWKNIYYSKNRKVVALALKLKLFFVLRGIYMYRS